MKTPRLAVLSLGLAMLAIPPDAACTPKEARTVHDVGGGILRAADLACALRSTLSDIPALAGFCKIEDPLSPALFAALEDLVAARNAGLAAGWRPKDAAHDASAE